VEGLLLPAKSAHGVNDVRQTEIHTTEQLVPQPSSSEVQILIVKFKRYKSTFSDQILAELIQAGGNTLRSEIQKITTSI
jgi:hypothetical protein